MARSVGGCDFNILNAFSNIGLTEDLIYSNFQKLINAIV